MLKLIDCYQPPYLFSFQDYPTVTWGECPPPPHLVNHIERGVAIEKIDGICCSPLDDPTLLNPGVVVPQDGPEAPPLPAAKQDWRPSFWNASQRLPLEVRDGQSQVRKLSSSLPSGYSMRPNLPHSLIILPNLQPLFNFVTYTQALNITHDLHADAQSSQVSIGMKKGVAYLIMLISPLWVLALF